MSFLELKIPPPAVALLTGGLMWLVSASTRFAASTFPARSYVAPAIALAGFVLAVTGFLSFRRAETTVDPRKPDATASLVVTGIYRYTRNPMYLGMLMVLLAWAVFLSNAPAFLLLPVFVLYLNRFQIVPEERALGLKFGEAYRAYCGRVRRWI